MLPEHLQARMVAELTYGKAIETDLRRLTEPYLTAVQVLSFAPVAERPKLLFRLGNWHDEFKGLVQQVQAIDYEKDLASLDEDWATAEKEEPPVEWLWHGWLPRRHVALFTSLGGVGKSAITMDWLARWLTGREMPDGQQINRQGDSVIFCDGEDFFQEYAARSRAWQEAGLWPKTDKTGIYLHRRLYKSKEYRQGKANGKWQLIDFADPVEQDRLISLVYRRKPEWLIIDSVSATFAETAFDERVKEPLGFITALTDEFNMATILIHHYNKLQRLDQPPDVNNIKGAGAFVNFCRSVFTLHYEKVTHPNRIDRRADPRILTPLKNNFAIPDPLGVWFKSLHPKGFYLEYCAVEDIYAMAAELREAEADKEATMVEVCAEWVVEYLSAAGPTSYRDLVRAAKEYGYSQSIIQRARQLAGDQIIDTVGPKRKGNQWAVG